MTDRRAAYQRSVELERWYTARRHFSPGAECAAATATLDRLDAEIALTPRAGGPTAALRWQRLTAARRLADRWRAARNQALTRPHRAAFRAGEWLAAELDALDRLAAAETEVGGDRLAAERPAGRARELESAHTTAADRGMLAGYAGVSATAYRLAAERAALAASGQPVGVALWRELVAGRRALELARWVRRMPGCFVRHYHYTRTELPLARRLAVSRRLADPSPAGRLTAAYTHYLTARELELWYRSWADRGIARETDALEARWQAREAWAEFVAAAAACPPDRRPPLGQPAPAGYHGTVARVGGGFVAFGPAADGLWYPARLTVRRPGRPDSVGTLVVIDIPAEGAQDEVNAILLPEPGLPNDVRPGDLIGP